MDGDTPQTALLFGSQRGRYADEDFGPLRGQLAGEQTASVVPLNTTIFMRGTPSV